MMLGPYEAPLTRSNSHFCSGIQKGITIVWSSTEKELFIIVVSDPNNHSKPQILVYLDPLGDPWFKDR